MAVTGGHLAKLDDTYLLVGGQRFDERYNPHGPNHDLGYHQEYTNEIRKFKFSHSNADSKIENYSAIYDTALFHRRDYNLLPQYNDQGEKLFTIFSGVFRAEVDLPYQSLVDVNLNGGKIQKDDDVPFTKTISVIERKEGRLKEYTLATSMLGYFGLVCQTTAEPHQKFGKFS
jgi:hypothetical protein